MRVLVTNDDGPPDNTISPFIYDLVNHLRSHLGWEVSVCIPSSQRSWIGKAYFIQQPVQLQYARVNAGNQYTASTSRQPLQADEQEWILLDATPATCASIGLNNLWPNQIDMVISGPNLGRNTSAAFCLSSGTVGGSMAGAMSGTPSIALSYGVFQKPYAPEIVEAAHHMSCAVLQHLAAHIFDAQGQRVASDIDVYSINVPLVPSLLDCPDRSKPPVKITSLGPGRYGRLFAPKTSEPANQNAHLFEGIQTPQAETSATRLAKTAGPSAIPANLNEEEENAGKSEAAQNNPYAVDLSEGQPVTFKFQPDISHLVSPDTYPEGSDIHAIHNGFISITPLKAAFATASLPSSLAQHVDSSGNCRW